MGLDTVFVAKGLRVRKITQNQRLTHSFPGIGDGGAEAINPRSHLAKFRAFDSFSNLWLHGAKDPLGRVPDDQSKATMPE